MEQMAGSGGAADGAQGQQYRYHAPPPPPLGQEANWFEGYTGKPQHPMYTTSAASYGAKPPTVHTVPTQFYARSQKFSEHLGTCGMYRNFSLNTDVDKSKV